MSASLDMESIRQEFITESRELLERAESVVLRLEQGPDAETINEVFRLVHTVKGNVGIFENQRLTRIAHSLESLLGNMRGGIRVCEPALIDTILVSLDWLKTALRSPDIESELDPDLEDRLRTSLTTTDRDVSESVVDRDARTLKSESQPPGSHEKGRRRAEGVRIPAKLVRQAEREGREVAAVFLELTEQSDGSLSAFLSTCAAARDAGDLLMCRLRHDEIPDLAAANGGGLPAVLLIASATPVLEVLDRYGWQARKLKIVSAPADRITASKQATTALPNTELETAPNPGTSGPISEGPADPPGTGVEHLRVSLPLIDRMINLAGATIGARNELMQLIVGYDEPRLHLVGTRLGQLVTNLQEEIMRTRLQEVRALFRRIPRVVRDVCRSTGKQANVSFEGEEVELDKNLIDAIGEAILHLVRNAVDHGIEAPAERARAGKPAVGQIKISAAVQNGSVSLTIQDDGGGINHQALRDAALRANLIPGAATLSDEEAADLIFLPGLSTAKQVTETSGRGVGMDAVRESFKRAGGSVTVSSTPGKGTCFQATLPQTLSIVTCLTVRLGDERYAVPQAAIDELARFEKRNVSTVGDQLVYRLRDRLLAVIDLGQLFYEREAAATAVEPILVILRTDRHQYGLVVEEIGNPEEILVKPMGAHFEGLALYSGAAVLGDGSVTPILDAGGIARFVNLQASLEDLQAAETTGSHVENSFENFLLFESSGQRFAISTDYSPRIEKYNTSVREEMLGRTIVKHDGLIVPVISPSAFYRTEAARAEPVFLILLRSGEMTVALSADVIHGVRKDLDNVQKNAFDTDIAISQALVDGRTVVVLNVPALIKQLRQDGFKSKNELEAVKS